MMNLDVMYDIIVAGIPKKNKINLHLRFINECIQKIVDKKTIATRNFGSVTKVKKAEKWLPKNFRLILGGLCGLVEEEQLSSLKTLKNISSLHLPNGSFVNASLLSSFINLKKLICAGSKIADVTPLSYLVYLKHLDLSASENVKDISPLSNLENLKILHLSYCINLENASSLSNFKKLEILTLVKTKIKNITSLLSLENICRLDISFCKNIKSEDVLKLFYLKKLTELVVCLNYLDSDTKKCGFYKTQNVINNIAGRYTYRKINTELFSRRKCDK